MVQTSEVAMCSIASRTSAISRLWVILLACGLMGLCPALEIPAKPYADLRSEDFRTREDAQQMILKWAREKPAQTLELLYGRSLHDDDPEVRQRCLDVVRDLVIDEYNRDGEGFIGIRMQDEVVQMPEGERPRNAVRITLVMPNSPAAEAGLRINDLIVGIEGKTWHDVAALNPFSEEVRKHKPGQRVKLEILRDGTPMEVPVVLMRRPLIADNPFLDERQIDIEAAEATARESYFQRWLERRRARD